MRSGVYGTCDYCGKSNKKIYKFIGDESKNICIDCYLSRGMKK